MSKNPVGLIILWWSETIISLRVLLFSMPVMINKYSSGHFSLSNMDDRFMALLSLTALLYFVVGILSISGFKFRQGIHYAAVIVVLLLTVGSLYLSNQLVTKTDPYYFLPLLFSVVIIALAGILRKTKQSA